MYESTLVEEYLYGTLMVKQTHYALGLCVLSKIQRLKG